jgi:hypothetical protein
MFMKCLEAKKSKKTSCYTTTVEARENDKHGETVAQAAGEESSSGSRATATPRSLALSFSSVWDHNLSDSWGNLTPVQDIDSKSSTILCQNRTVQVRPSRRRKCATRRALCGDPSGRRRREPKRRLPARSRALMSHPKGQMDPLSLFLSLSLSLSLALSVSFSHFLIVNKTSLSLSLSLSLWALEDTRAFHRPAEKS